MTPRGELSRFDTRTKQFLPFLGGISAQGVTFSKDGRYVAWVSYPDCVLWRANWDGSDPVQLTDPPMEVFLPRFSPDGKQIIFRDIPRRGHDVGYIVSSEGGRPQRLIPDDQGQVDDLGWSPDGHKVVFDRGGGGPKTEIRVFDVETHRVTTLPGSAGIYSPRWSPDGRHLAALSAYSPAEELRVFDFDTQQWSAPLPGRFAAFPEWSSDSKWIYFESKSEHGDWGIYRIGAKGGEAELVADLKNWHFAGWGAWFGLDPADEPLVLRDIGSSDIFALTLEEE
jgi:Tol biopolymer transport system component